MKPVYDVNVPLVLIIMYCKTYFLAFETVA